MSLCNCLNKLVIDLKHISIIPTSCLHGITIV